MNENDVDPTCSLRMIPDPIAHRASLLPQDERLRKLLVALGRDVEAVLLGLDGWLKQIIVLDLEILKKN